MIGLWKFVFQVLACRRTSVTSAPSIIQAETEQQDIHVGPYSQLDQLPIDHGENSPRQASPNRMRNQIQGLSVTLPDQTEAEDIIPSAKEYAFSSHGPPVNNTAYNLSETRGLNLHAHEDSVCTPWHTVNEVGGERFMNNANTSELIGRRAGENERRYIIVPEQLSSNTTDSIVAPVFPSDESDASALRPSIGRSDVLSDDHKLDGIFRKIHVRFDGDPEGSRALVQYIMHDTGSGCSLTFESKLKDLGLNFERVVFPSDLVSVTGEKFRPIGKRRLCFNYYDHRDKEFWTDIVVLPDPADGLKPAFDMLFGRDTIREVKAIKWNEAVIGVNYIHTAALATPFPSLWSSSPRDSLAYKPPDD